MKSKIFSQQANTLRLIKQEGNMVKPNIKYRVTLNGGERETLRKLVQKGNTPVYRMRHPNILFALDETPENDSWTDGR
jgi:hypothetical protein